MLGALSMCPPIVSDTVTIWVKTTGSRVWLQLKEACTVGSVNL